MANQKPDPSTLGFTNEEVERRVQETARRVLAAQKTTKDHAKGGKVRDELKPTTASNSP
jgi:hypothetical protein